MEEGEEGFGGSPPGTPEKDSPELPIKDEPKRAESRAERRSDVEKGEDMVKEEHLKATNRKEKEEVLVESCLESTVHNQKTIHKTNLSQK